MDFSNRLEEMTCRLLSLGCALLLVTACTIEHVGPPGIVLTRSIRIKPSEVNVYETASTVPGPFSIVDDLDIKDDGTEQPRVLEKRLRELAGDRGANAVILDPLNRKPNGTRIVIAPAIDNPFGHFRGTAIWLGDGPRPVINLGTVGGKAR